MPRRVVQMTSVHGPFDIRIFHKECMSLAGAGYDVTLIAPVDGPDRVIDGVKLRAISLPVDRLSRFTKTVPAVFKVAVEEDGDIYHFHDPELMPVGMLLKLRGKKVIYDVHEDYSSNMQKHWIPKPLQGVAATAVRFSEATLGRACDRIVAATPKIANQFQSGITRLVQNYPLLKEFEMIAGPNYQSRDLIVAYVGYLANSRGLREMTRAIELVRSTIPAKLICAGGARGGTEVASDAADSDSVQHLGTVDRTQVASLLSHSRIGLVVYHPTPNYLHGQPTKLLEYMAAGLPVVASDFPFYRRIINETNCGILVDPMKPEQIADAILWLLSNQERAQEMGERGRNAILERYNWERESKTLVETYSEL